MRGAEPENDNQREAGFSLVEVLVALLLVSIMATSLAAMAGQFRHIAKNTNRNLELGAMQAAARHIARQVEQAEMLPLDGGEPNAGFLSGSADELQFVAVVRLGSTEQSLRTIKINLREDSGLMQANRVRRFGNGGSSEFLILDAVQSLSFGYLGKNEVTGKSTWRESWDRADQLPSAISVTVTKFDKSKGPMTSTAIAWLTTR